MQGDSKRRFCEHCQLHVHNLSAMSRRERDTFVADSGGKACIAYRLDSAGGMITSSFWRTATLPFRQPKVAAMAVLSTLMPFLFSACSQTESLPPTLGVPMPPPTTDNQKPAVKLGSPAAPSNS